MTSMKLAALTTAAAIAVALAAAPAEAAKRKRVAVSRPAPVIVIGSRAPTRITVRRRSFLDPGTESLPFATQSELRETLRSWGIPSAPHHHPHTGTGPVGYRPNGSGPRRETRPGYRT